MTFSGVQWLITHKKRQFWSKNNKRYQKLFSYILSHLYPEFLQPFKGMSLCNVQNKLSWFDLFFFWDNSNEAQPSATHFLPVSIRSLIPMRIENLTHKARMGVSWLKKCAWWWRSNWKEQPSQYLVKDIWFLIVHKSGKISSLNMLVFKMLTTIFRELRLKQ